MILRQRTVPCHIQQEEIRIETENRLPDFWKENFNKEKIKGKTSKMLEVVLEEKRREIIKEWIKEGKIGLKGAVKG